MSVVEISARVVGNLRSNSQPSARSKPSSLPQRTGTDCESPSHANRSDNGSAGSAESADSTDESAARADKPNEPAGQWDDTGPSATNTSRRRNCPSYYQQPGRQSIEYDTTRSA